MADYTEDQLKQAARNAYADGNMEAAQRFLAQARKVSPSTGFEQPQGGSAVDQQNLETFESGANATMRGVGQGVSFRFGDELMGGLAALGTARNGGNVGQAYAGQRDASREANAAAQQSHPGLYGTGEVLGAGGVSLATAPLATGATALQTAGRSSLLGGVEGGLFGAGGADGGPIGPEIAKGAALGAGFGAAAPALVAGGRKIAKTVADPFAAALGRGNQSRANDVVNRAVSRSGRTIEELQQEAQAAVQAGQPDFALMDMLGSPGQGAASGITRTPGQGSSELTEFLQSRQLNAGDRTSGFLAEGLGATDTAAQRTAALTAQRGDDASVNYNAAREGASPVDVRGALGVIDTRLGEVSDAAGTGFQGDGIDSVFSRYRNRLAADRVPSDIDAMELSEFDRVLGVKQDISDDIGAAVRAGRNNEARELGRLQSELDKALEASSDGYRAANDTFAQQSRTIDAVDAGAKASAPRVRADDAIDQFAGMTPDAQTSFRSGLGDRLIGKIEGQALGANVASPLMRTRTDRLLSEVSQDPSKLRGQIARENTMAETRHAAIGGSKTADNNANMDDVQGVDVGMIANLLSGRIGAASVQGGQKLANAATGRNEATNQLIAKMLMSNDPATTLSPAILQQLRGQGQNRSIEALLRNAMARPISQ